MKTETIFNLAILEAKAGQQDQLRDALRALVPFTRQEAGCLDYTLFELADTPAPSTCGSHSGTRQRWMRTSACRTSRRSRNASTNCWHALQLVGLKEVP